MSTSRRTCRTRRLGLHGDGEHVTWSQEEYGMPGLQELFGNEIVSKIRNVELIRTSPSLWTVRQCKTRSKFTRCQFGGPGFELAFQEFLN